MNFVFRTVSLGGGFELNGSFGIYITMTDIPIICACQVTDPWRQKSDLWRHRCDTGPSMSTKRPTYSTEMHQNASFCAELNGEHAGFMPLRSTALEIWTRETKKSLDFRKFDLWPANTGSNIDQGPKIIPPIASTRRAQSSGLFREALRRFVWKRQGGSHSPYIHRRRWQNTVYGRRLTWEAMGRHLPTVGFGRGRWNCFTSPVNNTNSYMQLCIMITYFFHLHVQRYVGKVYYPRRSYLVAL